MTPAESANFITSRLIERARRLGLPVKKDNPHLVGLLTAWREQCDLGDAFNVERRVHNDTENTYYMVARHLLDEAEKMLGDLGAEALSEALCDERNFYRENVLGFAPQRCAPRKTNPHLRLASSSGRWTRRRSLPALRLVSPKSEKRRRNRA